jgi:hypothetical protein
MNNLSLIIDTTYKYSDSWPLCFGGLKEYFPKNIKKYVFTDKFDLDIENVEAVFYNNDDSYRNQFLNCIKQVKEKYIIYTSEDYILYNKVDIDEIYSLVNVLENDNNYDFIKFIKGPENTSAYPRKNLHIIDKSFNFFAQQASIWKTESLIKVFENSLPKNGRMQQEPLGSQVCIKLGLGGLQYHSGNEIKKGLHHWDSIIFPCIATAICKGKWNVTEYGDLLNPLFLKYNINPNIRGII